jgi:glycosyltransferase involved in cell wall biosynthesis
MSRLAVITDPDWGWLSIRIRWKQHIPRHLGEVGWFDLEDFGGWEGQMPLARRQKWLRTALEGRRAAKAAYAQGHREMLVATLQYAPLFPLYKDVRYFIYGDVTPKQYDALYCDEFDDRYRKRYMRAKYQRLASAGHHMLCMSPWFMDGLIESYGVKQGQATLLRPPIDVDTWQPQPRKDPKLLNILFIGGDFYRKGGDMLLAMAQDPRFASCRWHFMTQHEAQNTDKCFFYNGMKADTPEMRSLVQSCDLMVLPTKADCYSHAAIEAGAAGLPTVITDVGGIADIVETGVNGVLLSAPDRCQLEEAVLGYIHEPERLASEGLAARRRVEERNAVPVHMGIIKDVLSGS